MLGGAPSRCWSSSPASGTSSVAPAPAPVPDPRVRRSSSTGRRARTSRRRRAVAVNIDTEPWTRVTLTPAAGGDAVTLHDAVPAAAAARRLSARLRERRPVAAAQRTPVGSRRTARRPCAGPCRASTSTAPSPPSSAADGSRAATIVRCSRQPVVTLVRWTHCARILVAHSSGPVAPGPLGGRMVRGRNLGQAIGVVALVCATFGVSTASAQVDYEIMASLQFNFSNPGARSLAMAGALTGAGDDATGAWTNPGGLTNITRPEVGVEFRGFNFETPFVSSGRFNGTPTQIGIDTVERAVLRQHGQLDAQPVVRVGGRAEVPLRLRVLPHRSRQLRGRHPDGRAVLRPGRPVWPVPRRGAIAASVSSR